MPDGIRSPDLMLHLNCSQWFCSKHPELFTLSRVQTLISAACVLDLVVTSRLRVCDRRWRSDRLHVQRTADDLERFIKAEGPDVFCPLQQCWRNQTFRQKDGNSFKLGIQSIPKGLVTMETRHVGFHSSLRDSLKAPLDSTLFQLQEATRGSWTRRGLYTRHCWLDDTSERNTTFNVGTVEKTFENENLKRERRRHFWH